VRGWKKIFHANGNQKKAGVAILISDKIDLKIKITRDRKDTIYRSFCFHSASLCLLVGAFNPFTFKVIIDIYVPIAIFLIVWGLFL